MTLLPTFSRILTLSADHLHPATRALFDDCRDDAPYSGCVAVSSFGYFLPSDLGFQEALQNDCFDEHECVFGGGTDMASEFTYLRQIPDLVLLRAVARGSGATYVYIDINGPTHPGKLPMYNDEGTVTLPHSPGWRVVLSNIVEGWEGHRIVMPSYKDLFRIEQELYNQRSGKAVASLGLEPFDS